MYFDWIHNGRWATVEVRFRPWCWAVGFDTRLWLSRLRGQRRRGEWWQFSVCLNLLPLELTLLVGPKG